MIDPMRTLALAGAGAFMSSTTACDASSVPLVDRRGPIRSSEADDRYRDGTYVADGTYGGLPSRLTVTARIIDDRVVDVSVGTHATDPTSLDYQRRFAAAVPGVVKGRRIDEVSVGKLALPAAVRTASTRRCGASGTRRGAEAHRASAPHARWRRASTSALKAADFWRRLG